MVFDKNPDKNPENLELLYLVLELLHQRADSVQTPPPAAALGSANLPLSTLVGFTNTLETFTVAYCYITSESAESFLFLFHCLKDLIFHDACPGPGII